MEDNGAGARFPATFGANFDAVQPKPEDLVAGANFPAFEANFDEVQANFSYFVSSDVQTPTVPSDKLPFVSPLDEFASGGIDELTKTD